MPITYIGILTFSKYWHFSFDFRYNMEKFAGQPIDTLADSRRYVNILFGVARNNATFLGQRESFWWINRNAKRIYGEYIFEQFDDKYASYCNIRNLIIWRFTTRSKDDLLSCLRPFFGLTFNRWKDVFMTVKRLETKSLRWDANILCEIIVPSKLITSKDLDFMFFTLFGLDFRESRFFLRDICPKKSISHCF